ncbi:MAG: pyocin activator PrtN family protein [Marinobacterium sp.]|nr:pyocin activator PrtN family protein [Marinobacterium sp.]
MSQTLWMIMAQFGGQAVIPLDACKEMLGYKTLPEANKAECAGTLPVPAFKLREGNRVPRMIHAADLAAYIDAQHAKATASWRAINGITPQPDPLPTPNRRKRTAA